MANFGIVTVNFDRPRVLKLWCASIDRLRSEFGYFPVVCVSESSDIDLCEAHTIAHITHGNKPITQKWNKAFKYMRGGGVDYVVISGSDDIISTELLETEIKQMHRGMDLIGVDKIYFYAGDGQFRGKLTSITGRKILAPAKAISKKVLDKINWVICPTDKNWGMDAIMDKTIAPFVSSRAIVQGMVVDVKTKVNLNSFKVFKNRQKENPQEFYDILSEKELELLKQL